MNDLKTILIRYRAAFFAAAVVLFIFYPALNYPFLLDWDDAQYIRDLAMTKANLIEYGKFGMMGLWTPLTMYSLMLDRWIAGGTESAFIFHLTNILLQCGAAILFGAILKRLNIRDWIVFLCAAIWAVYPQRMESVIWIAERKDVLSGFFALASVFFFMRAWDRKKIPWAAVLLFLLAMASKPSPIGVPVICYVYACRKNPRLFRWKYLAGAAGVMAAAVLAVMLVMKFVPDFESPGRVVSVVVHNLFFYASNSWFPVELNPCYPFVDWRDPWILLAAPAMIVLISCMQKKAGVPWRTIFADFAVFAVVYLVLFAPFTGGFLFNPTDYADRYSYLPSLAVWAYTAYSAEKILKSNPKFIHAMSAGFAVLAALASAQSMMYRTVWRSERALFAYAVEGVQSPNERALVMYGRMGLIAGNPVQVNRAAEILWEKYEGEAHPRYGEPFRESLRQTSLIFRICGAILTGTPESLKMVPALYRELCRTGKTEYIDGENYLSRFKELMFRYVGADARGQLALLKWCHDTFPKPDVCSSFDYSLEGSYYFVLEKNPVKALEMWKLALKEASPEDRVRLEENIGTAEKMIQEKHP